MPGMNMDPMVMQQMMMSGGFGGAGMGMNGMNMGMGMGGYEGGAGAGFNNGWNGQQSWNVGQDNYNPNAAGMGHGDYGSNNSGYPQSQGYNQGNYGRGNHYNNYQNNGYQSRGRGRGGFGRGGYGYGSNEVFSQQYPQQSIANPQVSGAPRDTSTAPTGPIQGTAPTTENVDEFGREIRQTSQLKDAQGEGTDAPNDDTAQGHDRTEDSTKVEGDDLVKDTPGEVNDSCPKPIQTLDEAEAVSYPPYNQYGQNNFSQGGFNQAYHAHGGSYGAMQPPKPVDVPINAPTGPKAMREGLPNTGISGFKARGLSIASTRGGPTPTPAPAPVVNGTASVVSEATPSVIDNKDRDRSKSPTKQRSKSRDRERSRSKERRRSNRHRSASPLNEDEKETERRRLRRKERQRHPAEEGGERVEVLPVDKVDNGTKEEHTEERPRDRSRSASPSDSKRSSHRSRRDKDRHRERERDDRDRHYRERDDHRDQRSHTHR